MRELVPLSGSTGQRRGNDCLIGPGQKPLSDSTLGRLASEFEPPGAGITGRSTLGRCGPWVLRELGRSAGGELAALHLACDKTAWVEAVKGWIAIAQRTARQAYRLLGWRQPTYAFRVLQPSVIVSRSGSTEE